MATHLINHRVSIRSGAYLPHWTLVGATYSVTFRLADALPQTVLIAWESERAAMQMEVLARMGRLLPEQQIRFDELFSAKIEKYLDSGHGCCWLAQAPIAKIVVEALRHFDLVRYAMLAWCIMPNHVHAIIRPAGNEGLPGIMHSWKSYTAKSANSFLRRRGPFWQAEYYDHLIRDDHELKVNIGYILQNPAKAGLHGWQWSGSSSEVAWASSP